MKPIPTILISKWWLLTILMVVFHFTLVAQPPTISSFTPASGTIGDFVTITGTNFSSNQPDNIVTFNGVRAEVLMSTSTTLIVIPKNGTTSGTISVTVAGNSVTSAASFTVISNFGAMQFASPTTYNVSGLNGRLHETDFNGDGNKDFAVLVPSGVSVFLGDGLGGFTAQPQINLPGVPVDVLVKDFNQDNQIDIVTTNNTTQQLTIFLGNGNGTFAAGVNYIIGFGPQRVASGDFNHDGFDDLIITVYAGFNVFFGTGAGTFTSLTAYAMGAYPVDLAVNDFNNDGNLDAAIGNGWDPNVSIFLGSAVGTFTFSHLISGVYTGDQQIISEDFNNDGKNDLVAGLGTTSFSLILGNGDGTFGTPQFLPTDFARAFHARDINGDNKTDLVVPNFSTNTLKIFTNDGLANFSLGQTISTLSGPGPVLLTDLNGDHLLDMISCSYTQSYLTVRMGAIIPVIASFTPTSGPAGTTVTITGINFSSTPANNTVYFGAVKATVTAATPTQLTVTAPVGTTARPITVTVNGLTAHSSQPFSLISTNGPVNAAAFAGKQDFVSASQPLGLATGDFDRDGKVDVVTANRTGLTLNIYRNTNTNGFIDANTLAAPVTKALLSDPFLVQVGDLDGDGLLDIAVPIASVGLVSVFRNTSTIGTISFDNRVDYALGGDPLRLIIQDLDGDGKPEIVAARRFANAISVLKNNSKTGGFNATSFAAPVNFTTGTEPYDLAVADFDADGKPDIVATNNLSASVSVFTNKSSACTIDATSFAAKVDFTTGNRPQGIVVGDFDGDAKVDIAVANNVGGTTISILQNVSTATIAFASKVDFTAGTEPAKLAVGDVNGDSKPDLVATNFLSNTVSVFANTSSSGTISTASFAAAVNYATGINPSEVTIADIDGDQRSEILVSNHGSATFSILSAIPTITSFNPASGPTGTTVTITGSSFSSLPGNNIVYFGATRAAVTSATTTQLIVTVPIGSTFEPISVQVSGLTGYSRSPFLVTFPGGGSVNTCSFEPAVSFATAVGPGALMTADFDGDGKVDAGVSNRISRTIYVYRNTAIAGQVDASSFASPLSIATPPSGDPYNAKTADLDGDGKLDIVLTVAGTSEVVIFRNTSTIGSLSFDSYIGFPAGADPLHAAIADFDADGKPDIAAVNRFSNTLSIYKNTASAGSFSASSFAAKVDFAVGTEPYVVRAADLNSDGKPDIVVTNLVSNSLFVFENTATAGSINSGSFASPVTLITGTTPHTSSLTDFDRDGLIDIAIANAASNTVSVFRNVSAGGPISAASFAAKVDFPAGATSVDFATGDVDGDGKADIAITNQGTNKVAILKNTSTPGSIDATSFASIVSFTSGTLPASIMLADIDGDGKVDMLNTNMNGQSLNIYRNITDAPPPTISLLAPAAGATGSPVTITGTNFNTTPASNIVTFNGVSAVVTASTATSITTSVPAGATSGPITVMIGCSQATSATNFNVCTVPAAPGVTSASRCGAGTLTLIANGGVPGAYVWYISASGGSALPGETNAAFVTPSLSLTTTYFVSISNGGCESTRTPVTATINVVPAAPSVTPASGCSPSSAITLLASGGAIGQYRWYTSASGGVAIAGQTNSSFITPTISASTTYYVSINDGVCESARIPVLADIQSCLPQIKTAVLTATVGGEASLPLPALVTTVGSALDVNSFNVVVPPISGAKTSITAGTIHIDYAGITFAGTDRFTIRACDMVGNCGQQELTVDVQGEITVFNAISPNGDGKNETFFVQNINLLPDTRQNHMTIFNRWGSIVYEVDNYDNSERVFQGLGNDGDKLPAGTYFYRIEFESGLKPVTGFISLRQ